MIQPGSKLAYYEIVAPPGKGRYGRGAPGPRFEARAGSGHQAPSEGIRPGRVLAGVVYGFASDGPLGFRAACVREVRERLDEPVSQSPVTEVDFVSDDRYRASEHGTHFTRQRWSTPVGDYRSFGPRRATARGEGRRHSPEGEFVYLELELLDLEINGASP